MMLRFDKMQLILLHRIALFTVNVCDAWQVPFWGDSSSSLNGGNIMDSGLLLTNAKAAAAKASQPTARQRRLGTSDSNTPITGLTRKALLTPKSAGSKLHSKPPLNKANKPPSQGLDVRRLA